MSNTIRIRTTPNGGDKYLKVKLEQDFDFIEILSLKISQEDTYIKYCSDYGVIVGRVSINNGFGVPNARVSVFIPLDDIDKNDPLIKGLYPFEVITDKDSDGVRYNLFPRDGDESNECSTPIGTFPNKREILDNDTALSIYCKYYKFTTTTNHAGDFMIFGVPLGTYTVHVDADISDIGIASQRPYDLISQGTPAKMFHSPTKFNTNKNLDKLIQVKTMNAGVNVQPFWGDPENCEIGISRLDFELNYTLRPAAIFMGSIYGDQDKHSINKHCRPRKKLGELCEQVTGPGSINMIRKTLDGQTEDFDVEGGRVIDDDGAWAYQIPMNLDYMVTNEVGELILSQDPNKGIPTRARVRFNIGMDETGGEGRLRTRARYLVPNNPTQNSEVDYTFGSDTKDSSFRDMYWNKIYSVSNFITRYQKQRNLSLNPASLGNPSKVRGMTAIKDVDACAGDKTPFPYNRVNTELNPIFFIICLIIKIISFLIVVMNSVIIPLINLVIRAIRLVISGICAILNVMIAAINVLIINDDNELDYPSFCNTPIPFIPCITILCPSDNGTSYAPGCINGGLDGGDAFSTAGNPTYGGINSGLDDCIAFEMAKALNLFQFDFYNDWVNGSLFGFLLKYKKKRKHSEKFCEYECSHSGVFTSVDGVDGNGNGIGDNRCQKNMLIDTCYQIGNDANDFQTHYSNIDIRDGLIKKVGNEFFYAATTHTDVNLKLFSTDIINLGSVFDCDWQGFPKVNSYLIPSSYKIPPDVQELNDDNTAIEITGMINTESGQTQNGLFFSINCFGVHVSHRQCLNLRHICEIGVELDQAQEDINGNFLISPDGNIGALDIDDDGGKFFRDMFYSLNTPNTNFGQHTTNFNLNNLPEYNFANTSDNGADYAVFRGYTTDNIATITSLYNNSSYVQPKHSFFFYFGLIPGKTGLDKMNERFFTNCTPIIDSEMLIKSSSIQTTLLNTGTGSITFTIVGGVGPFTYTVNGVSILYSNTGVVTTALPTVTITGLFAGVYTIAVIDSLGNPISQTISVVDPPSLFCSVVVTKNASSTGINDGEITITSVGGGSGNYTYEVKNFAGGAITPPTPIPTMPFIIGGIAVDNTGGYTVIITDSANDTCITNGLKIFGPSIIVLSPSIISPICYGDNTGSLSINVTGGQSPYTSVTTGPSGFGSSSLNMSNLIAGTYVTTVTDSLSTSTTITNILTQPIQLIVSTAVSSELGKQCDPTQYIIPFLITNGIVPGQVTVEYNIDSSTTWTQVALTYVNATTLMYLNIPSNDMTSKIKIRFTNADGCYSNIIQISKSSVTLPPSLLTLSLGSIPANCTPLHAKFNVGISHLTRAPYTISVVGGTPTSIVTSTSSTLLDITVATGTPSLTLTVTDSKGCVSPAINVNYPTIKVPTSILTANVTRSGTGPYTYTISASGGVAPYTGFIGTTPSTSSPTYSAIITDANGCTVVANY